MKRIVRFMIDYIRLMLAWLLVHTVNRSLLKQNIWLIREKRDEARDNGYHFFKYLREHHPEIHAFYVITRRSVDRYKIEQYGNLIEADSWQHCLYFLAAKYSIGSQPYGAFPFRFGAKEMNYVQMLCNQKQKVVFLQHGIIKDKLAVNSFGYNFCNIDYFVTSAQREYDFVKATYQYPDDAIGCVGLARFDRLLTEHIVEDKILVMPTWRMWLASNPTESDQEKKKRFNESGYFKAYSNLLQDKSLIQYLRNHNYTLVFYMHYKLQPYSEMFRLFENDVIIIADQKNYDVQDLLMSSKLMITDYSSVYFDFAYMNKPVIYYQFDKEQFRQGHFAEGYFSYEKDGFGPCFDKWENMRQYIFDMIDKQCCQPEQYDLRVQDFFNLRDNHNCERTYNAIKSLEER